MIKVVNSMLEEKVVGAEKYMRPICLGTASASISTTETREKKTSAFMNPGGPMLETNWNKGTAANVFS